MQMPGLDGVAFGGTVATALPSDAAIEQPTAGSPAQGLQLDYGMSAGDQIASPGALFDQALGSLRGFLKRAEVMGKSDRRTHDGVKGQSGIDLHAGPALASFESAGTQESTAFAGSGDIINFSEAMMQQLLDSMSFELEAEMISHTTSGIGTSIDSLVKGQ